MTGSGSEWGVRSLVEIGSYRAEMCRIIRVGGAGPSGLGMVVYEFVYPVDELGVSCQFGEYLGCGLFREHVELAVVSYWCGEGSAVELSFFVELVGVHADSFWNLDAVLDPGIGAERGVDGGMRIDE